ncbi:MAG: type II toxin-antitoxin system PemK/MazF family toxin [Lentimicrobiaceae bacterium]|nr:type II toxin-antitoxin system PemK/MazF family toxin [Lentimicrobiaceae bacterium]
MKRYELYAVNLDPTIGVEMKKTRPCLIISPDEMNKHLQSVIVAPLTTQFKIIPTRIKIEANHSNGLLETSYVALDQLKTIDKIRCVTKIGIISDIDAMRVADILVEIFQY